MLELLYPNTYQINDTEEKEDKKKGKRKRKRKEGNTRRKVEGREGKIYIRTSRSPTIEFYIQCTKYTNYIYTYIICVCVCVYLSLEPIM